MNTPQQTEMQFDRATRFLNATASRLHTEMLAILDRTQCWMTRADLAVYGLSDRACRRAREFSPSTIIFGQQGYRSAKYATLEELDICANTLISQGTKMTEEGIGLKKTANIRRAYEQRVCEPTP